MQVNHEEVDAVLNSRRKRIEDNMMHMQRGVGIQTEGWSEVRMTSSGPDVDRKPGYSRPDDAVSGTHIRSSEKSRPPAEN